MSARAVKNDWMVELRFRENGLIRSAEVFSPFWIDWVRFDIVGDGDDADLLSSLLGHAHYAHGYLGPRGSDSYRGAHGPYVLDELTPSLFVPVESAVAKAEITEWLVDRTEPQWTLRSLGLAFIDSQPGDASTYRLPDMRPEHITDIGWIVGSDGGFNEWVFIDVRRATLTLVVATDD